jgi:hypothetical protein
MTTYNSIRDIRRYVSDCTHTIDPSQYIEYEQLLDNVTHDLIHYIRQKGWSWGESFDISEEEFWDLLKPYEK